MPKEILFFLSLSIILSTAFLVLFFNNKYAEEPEYKPGRNAAFDTAVNQAQYLYGIRKEKGQDFTNGPCLTNALMPGWVVDIVHNPRKEIDNYPENQCSGYLEGQAEHVVELDMEGDLINAK